MALPPTLDGSMHRSHQPRGTLEPLPNRGVVEDARSVYITELFRRHYSQLVRLAVASGADDEAEDVVEEAFCELHRRWGGLRDAESAMPYLRSIVCNLARMRLRHLEVIRRHHEEPLPAGDSAESVALRREDRRAVIAALRRLPGRQREALLLRYWLGLHEAEVADAMGISCGAVKAHTARGIQQLRTRDELGLDPLPDMAGSGPL